MVKPGKFGHLHLVYHFTVPLIQIQLISKSKLIKSYPFHAIIIFNFLLKFKNDAEQENYKNLNILMKRAFKIKSVFHNFQGLSFDEISKNSTTKL